MEKLSVLTMRRYGNARIFGNAQGSTVFGPLCVTSQSNPILKKNHRIILISEKSLSLLRNNAKERHIQEKKKYKIRHTEKRIGRS